jgi:uncharacterized protein YqeY
MAEESQLKLQINDELKQAMKSGDAVGRSALRMLLSSIKNAEIAQRGPLSEGDILGVISKDVKQRQESIEAFRQGNRQDLMEKEQAELAVIEKYMPAQMSREEIVEAAKAVIKEVGAEGPSDKGKVMPRIIAQLKGKADGREINEVVTELLKS